MVWPVDAEANLTNLNSGDGNPSLARIDLYNALVLLNDVIGSANEPAGALVLDNFGKINANMVPSTLTGSISIEPPEQIVTLKYVLKIVPQTTAQLQAMTGPFLFGDIAMVSDADAGEPAVCFYDGTNWRKMPLSTLDTL
jgi:hypothetical protein